MNEAGKELGTEWRSKGIAYAWISAGITLIALILFVLRFYYIKAYSDPLHWLIYARDFATQVRDSKWPLGYPLLLKPALSLLGPYWVFLANLPVIVLMVALVGKLTERAALASEDRTEAALTGAGCIAFFTLFNLDNLVYLTNPYRDPLSHLLLLGSAVLLIRYVYSGGRSLWALILSALMAGFNYCVREPSVLFIVPLGLFALVSWVFDRRIKFWKSVILFGLFLVIGTLPLFIQGHLRTAGGSLLPPQAATEHKLFPGMYGEVFFSTCSRAFHYFLGTAGLVAMIVFFLGIVRSFARKNLAMIFLILMGAVVFFVFYSFYWTFVVRYFLVVTLFAVPLVGYGLYGAISRVLAWSGKSHLKNRALSYLTLLLSVTTAASMLLRASDPGFNLKVGKATNFIRTFNQFVPQPSLVLAPRHICEILTWFTRNTSFQVEALFEPEYRNEIAVHKALTETFKTNENVFAVDCSSADDIDPAAVLVKHVCDQIPIVSFRNSFYEMKEATGVDHFTLFRLKPWKHTQVEHILTITNREPVVLQINALMLWMEGYERQYARLFLNGRMIDDRVENGANYYLIDPSQYTPPYRLEMSSDQPIAESISPKIFALDDSMRIDYVFGVEPSHDNFISLDYLFPTNDYWNPHLLMKQGAVRLPAVAACSNDVVLAKFTIRALSPLRNNYIPVQVSADGHSLGTIRIHRDRMFHAGVVPVPVYPNRLFADLTLDIEGFDPPLTNTTPDDTLLDLDHVVTRHIQLKDGMRIAMGANWDVWYLNNGFYEREGAFRWTQDKAGVVFYLNQPTNDLVLTVRYDDIRPTNAPATDLKLTFNGHPIDYTDISRQPDSKRKLVQSIIPKDWIREIKNNLDFECIPWTPRTYHINSDERILGIMLDYVDLQPVGLATNQAPLP